MGWMRRLWAWASVVLTQASATRLLGCALDEFPCRSGGQCVGLDRFCDGTKQCADGSDEPAGCSPCNRTYYGKVGGTYKIQVSRPGLEALPHFCQLTFIASGAEYGDLVQLTIEKFSLGRFVSHTKKGCPDGHMQIEELSRPLNAGYWCGTAWGSNVYFSETAAVTLMLRVFNLTTSTAKDTAPGVPAQEPVLLRLTYRFLSRQKAVLRYGPQYNPYYRGEVLPGTFCDKFYENCDVKNCRIQSPNFPGIYPRNLTCYFHIRQTRVPDGKVALVSVQQKNPYLIYVKDKNAPHISKEKYVRVGDVCNTLHDYIVLFDGNTTRAPVLLKACKGGSLTSVTASGSHMLVMFNVSPFDFPFQDSPRRRVFGFQLDVKVRFVDKTSTSYVQHNVSFVSLLNPFPIHTYSCQWTISSYDKRSGYIQAPVHTVLANTTCIWRLNASYGEVVWLYFINYRHVPHKEMAPPLQCSNTLTIHDGNPYYSNTSLLTSVCRPDKYPRVCSGVKFSKNNVPLVSCSKFDSYISASRLLTMSISYAIGTIPSHVEFLARYEFVDRRQWGDPTPHGGPCDRTFTPYSNRRFASPRDVFMYGRGGSKRIMCVYSFKMEPHQRIVLRILHSHIDSCFTSVSSSSRLYECNYRRVSYTPSIMITESPWMGAKMARGCLCNVSNSQPVTMVSYTNNLELTFSVSDMNPSHDFKDFFFEGEFEIITAPLSSKGEYCSFSEHVHDSPHGNFTMGVSGLTGPCDFLPRLIEANDGSFIFLRIKGFVANSTNCGVNSRVNIFAVESRRPLVSICPEPSEEFTHVFSNGWSADSKLQKSKSSSNKVTENFLYNYTSLIKYTLTFQKYSEKRALYSSRNFIVEYTGNYSGRVFVTWTGVWKPLKQAPLISEELLCPHKCPEIKACLPSDLWCDGKIHCPSGADEGPQACGLLFTLPWASLVSAGALSVSLVILLLAVLIHACRNGIRKRRMRRRQFRNQQMHAPMRKPPHLKGPAVPTDLLLLNQENNTNS